MIPDLTVPNHLHPRKHIRRARQKHERTIYRDEQHGEIVEIGTGIVLEEEMFDKRMGVDEYYNPRITNTSRRHDYGLGTAAPLRLKVPWTLHCVKQTRLRRAMMNLKKDCEQNYLPDNVYDMAVYYTRKLIPKTATPITKSVIHAIIYLAYCSIRPTSLADYLFRVRVPGMLCAWCESVHVVSNLLDLQYPGKSGTCQNCGKIMCWNHYTSWITKKGHESLTASVYKITPMTETGRINKPYVAELAAKEQAAREKGNAASTKYRLKNKSTQEFKQRMNKAHAKWRAKIKQDPVRRARFLESRRKAGRKHYEKIKQDPAFREHRSARRARIPCKTKSS